MTTQTNDATGPLPSEASLAEKPIAPQSTNGSTTSSRFIPKSASKHIREDMDAEQSQNDFFLKLLAQSVGDSWAFFLGSVLSMTALGAAQDGIGESGWVGAELDRGYRGWQGRSFDHWDPFRLLAGFPLQCVLRQVVGCSPLLGGHDLEKVRPFTFINIWTTCYVIRISLSLSLVLTNESFL